ncbi:MAG TPA: SprT family zinc-dependent metalloprotease [Candidatus Saccharimonadales bacterium]|nr:SprT family zinc-dependent metalloprotease [Candidatus Saccharimonadales bacterium]
MENVLVVRSRKRKSVGIQVLRDATVKVTIPFFFPKFYVNKILDEKKEWIQDARSKMLSRKVSSTPEGQYLYLGKSYPLQIRPGQKELIEVADKMYVATYSEKFFNNHLTSWYKQQARKVIVERVNLYSERAGLKFHSIAITTAETRWGSCSSNKTLNFNWKLIMAPLEVIDYVVTHELAHLTELNHSHAFWETVRKMYPLYREYRTWLRRYGHTLAV